MCVFKSGIILKDRIYIPDHNKHRVMLEELGIEDTGNNAENIFVRFELSPSHGDVFSPIESWHFRVDQDIIPDWFVKQFDRERSVSAVIEWAKNRIFKGVSNLNISAGSNYYFKDCKDIILKGNAQVERLENSTVGAMLDSSTVGEMRDNSMVSIPDSIYSKRVAHERIILCDNSLIKDGRTKTIYQSGGWELVMTEKDQTP